MMKSLNSVKEKPWAIIALLLILFTLVISLEGCVPTELTTVDHPAGGEDVSVAPDDGIIDGDQRFHYHGMYRNDASWPIFLYEDTETGCLIAVVHENVDIACPGGGD